MTALTIYKINAELRGELPDAFDQLLIEDARGAPSFDHTSDDFVARIYVPYRSAQPPKWKPFVKQGFPDAEIGLSQSQQGLLVALVRRESQERVFAIAFGHARHSLRQELIDPAFGRRTALNVIYEGHDEDSEDARNRVRQVGSRTIEDNVKRSKVQRSRDTTFDTFGVDPERDLLDQIVGIPTDTDRFGSRITGGGSFHLDVPLAFDSLPDLLWDIEAAHDQKTYRDNFSWVDRVRAVTNPDLVELLRAETLKTVLERPDDAYLAPPEIVNWDQIQTFKYEFGKKPEHDDIRLEDYIAAINGSRSPDLTVEKLTTQRVVAQDGNRQALGRWPIFRCLTLEVDFEGKHYVLDEGHFYEVSTDYLSELDDFIASIASPALQPPGTTAGRHEAKYNEEDFVSSNPDLLLLDKKTVKLDKRTTPIEICDVMSSAGELVHVKRKLGSSDLSHLFAQGYVSAETMHAGPELRAAIHTKITTQAQDSSRDPEVFTRLIKEPFAPQSFTIVYAILADWGGKPPQERLPFFSKVNLRHYHRRLRQMGYDVALVPVSAT